MNRIELAKRLIRLAKEVTKEDDSGISKEEVNKRIGQSFIASIENREWLTADDVDIFCPKCASVMRKKNINKIKTDRFFSAYEKLPWDECIKKMKDQSVKDPEAVCGHIKYHVSPKHGK